MKIQLKLKNDQNFDLNGKSNRIEKMTNRKKKLSRIMSNVRFLKSGQKSNPYLTRSLRGPANDLHARSRSDRVAWMDGWVDGWVVIFYPLRFSSYFVGIYIRYISTYIRNKNSHQYSYGFQNFMSSLGS